MATAGIEKPAAPEGRTEHFISLHLETGLKYQSKSSQAFSAERGGGGTTTHCERHSPATKSSFHQADADICLEVPLGRVSPLRRPFPPQRVQKHLLVDKPRTFSPPAANHLPRRGELTLLPSLDTPAAHLSRSLPEKTCSSSSDGKRRWQCGDPAARLASPQRRRPPPTAGLGSLPGPVSPGSSPQMNASVVAARCAAHLAPPRSTDRRGGPPPTPTPPGSPAAPRAGALLGGYPRASALPATAGSLFLTQGKANALTAYSLEGSQKKTGK